jgi:hypothetical protein
MKSCLRNLITVAVLFGVSLAKTHATEPKVQILTDREMASVEGGLCIFSQCQPGLPTGKCQPVPADYKDLCLPTTCSVELDQIGNTVVFACVLKGEYTCTGGGAYRECIPAIVDVCLSSPTNVCGSLVLPFCKADLAEKTCICGVNYTQTPCDWTNCILPSQ